MHATHGLRKLSLIPALGILMPAAARPQAAEGGTATVRSRMSYAVSVMQTRFSDPIFREPGPGGGSELPVSGSLTTWGIRGSATLWPISRLGVEAGVLVLGRARFDDFVFTDEFGGGGSGSNVSYDEPTVQLWFFDLGLRFRLTPRAPLFVSGVLGMGQERESYAITGAAFPEWNGSKTLSEFQYSYGIGAQVGPFRHVALFGEWRVVPGDLITEIPGGGCHIYVYSQAAALQGTPGVGFQDAPACKRGTKNRATLLSVGLSISLP